MTRYRTNGMSARSGWRQLLRTAALAIVPVCLALGTAHVLNVQRKYEAIPPATTGDARSLEQRLASIDELISSSLIWPGMFQVGRERSQLRAELERLRALQADSRHDEATREADQVMLANSARERARGLVEGGDYKGAIVHYHRSLDAAPEDWQHREQVQKDLEAIQDAMQRGDG